MKKALNILAFGCLKEITNQIATQLNTLEINYNFIDICNYDEIDDILIQKDLDIIIINKDVESISYLDFLHKIKESYPYLVRILVADEWSKELIIKTNNLVHLIIEKSFMSETLVDTIIRAIQLQKLLENKNLSRLINSFDELPIMQNTYIELLHLLKSPDVPLKKIADLIAKDYSLTARTLQVSNMSIFTHIGRINNVQNAVVFLGTNVLKAIVLYLQVFNFESENLQAVKTIKALESHSTKVAEFAKTCAQYYKCSNEIQDHTFTASLLHDIGKFIVVTKTNKWDNITCYAAENGLSINQAEKDILGTTHAEIGAYLLNLWGFPTSVVNAVAYHHNPSKAKNNTLGPLTFVHLSEAFISGDSLDHEDNIYHYLDLEYLNNVNIDGDLPVLLRLFNYSIEGAEQQ
ncbi:MAG TPA: response regulator [Candidatus Cloacimonadota bacterium]|nr:response regulator [Candidatus Cloacimonadota bacterium]HQB41535.1 response regulator [Candidatus Cloacimonadota bacterium]